MPTVTDTFTYTLTDTDGDVDTAVLSITDLTPEVVVDVPTTGMKTTCSVGGSAWRAVHDSDVYLQGRCHRMDHVHGGRYPDPANGDHWWHDGDHGRQHVHGTAR